MVAIVCFPRQGAQKLTEENLKVVWAEFSTLSLAVFVKSKIASHRQAHPCLELKTQPKFFPVSLNFVNGQGKYAMCTIRNISKFKIYIY